MVRWRRLNGGCFPLCHCERKSHPAPVDFQGLCFSLVLWQQPQPFLLVFPKLVKQFKLLPSIHWSTELWSRVLLLKTTSTNTTPFAYDRLLFLVFIFLLSLAFLPHFLFPQNREWAGLSLVWHHWVFPRHLPQSCSDVRQISLQWARSRCVYSLIDAGMLEVTHESKSAFHAYSWHPIEATHCVCVWVWSPAPCGPLLVVPCFAVPLHCLIECCFEMLTL